MIRIESAGSIWLLDGNRYMRMPREEKPRDHKEHGGPEAGTLQDFVWHPFTSTYVSFDLGRSPRLVFTDDMRPMATAPLQGEQVDLAVDAIARWKTGKRA
jgi:hypothetical protein